MTYSLSAGQYNSLLLQVL